MRATQNVVAITVEDYLEGELHSPERHEYLGGIVYAMAGSSEDHNLIVSNLVAALRPGVRGGPCRVYSTDLKVHVQLAGEDIFYYPDVMVACDPRDTNRYFRDFPKLIIEIMSPTTERTDRREKFLNYTQIGTLEEYILIAQDRIEITVFRRSNQWQPEVFRAREELLKFSSLEVSLPLSAVYEDVAV